MLLSQSGHMKLADFDRTEDMLSGTEPFARLLGDEGSLDRGTYGEAGCPNNLPLGRSFIH